MSLATDFMLKEFRTEKNAYLYCGKTNQILRIAPVMTRIIPLYEQFSLDDIQHRLGEAFTADEITQQRKTDNIEDRGNVVIEKQEKNSGVF